VIVKGEDIKLIKSWFEKRIKTELIYRGSKDGYDEEDCHYLIDDEGPTLTIIRSEHARVFGGFTAVSWELEGGQKADPHAFIFSVSKKTKH
jgi:hypothetical protein